MGLFGKKREQDDEKSYKKSGEHSLRESIEIENIQKEVTLKQEEIESITKKLQNVREEYSIATSNLMSVKKENNQKKMELDMTYLEYKGIKTKIKDADEKFNKNEKSIDELDKIELNLKKIKVEIENAIKELDEINKNIIESKSSLHEIDTQKIMAEKELEKINLKLYNNKQVEKNLDQSNPSEASGFTPEKKKIVEDEITTKRETQGIIEAASVVVGSLKLKLSMVEKETHAVQALLEKERNEHSQTRKELEKLKEKLNSN